MYTVIILAIYIPTPTPCSNCSQPYSLYDITMYYGIEGQYANTHVHTYRTQQNNYKQMNHDRQLSYTFV